MPDREDLELKIIAGGAMRKLLDSPEWRILEDEIQRIIKMELNKIVGLPITDVPEAQGKIKAYQKLLAIPQCLIQDGDSASKTLAEGVGE